MISDRIEETMAEEVIGRVFGQYLGMELATALARAQASVYGDSPRRPYVMVGCHFQRIRKKTLSSRFGRRYRNSFRHSTTSTGNGFAPHLRTMRQSSTLASSLIVPTGARNLSKHSDMSSNRFRRAERRALTWTCGLSSSSHKVQSSHKVESSHKVLETNRKI